MIRTLADDVRYSCWMNGLSVPPSLCTKIVNSPAVEGCVLISGQVMVNVMLLVQNALYVCVCVCVCVVVTE